MNEYSNIYIDEAGNTGSDVLNADQPYFVLAAVHFSDEELLQIQRDIAYGKELHFVKMKKNSEGRIAIKRLLQHPWMNEEHITLELVDKQFCIYAQIVDMTVEPVFHYIFHEDLYTQRNNILLANCLYTFCRHHQDKPKVNAFLESFVKMMREQTDNAVVDFYKNVEQLSSVSDKPLKDILLWISLSQRILDCVLVEDKTFCLDTTLSSLLRLVEHWREKLNRELDIIMDNSKQIEAGKLLIDELSQMDNPPQLVGYDTRKHLFPLPIHSVQMADSASSFGVQLADAVASAFAFVWNDTSTKYKLFRNELNAMPFFKIKGYPLMPASEEELFKEVDSSEDSDSLEFIAQHISGQKH